MRKCESFLKKIYEFPCAKVVKEAEKQFDIIKFVE